MIRSCVFIFLLVSVSCFRIYESNDNLTLALNDVKRLSLTTNTVHPFTVNVPPRNEDVSGFIIQLHTQYHTLTLSSSSSFEYDQTVSGTNIGLWNGLSKDSSSSHSTTTFYVNISCNASCNTTSHVLVLSAVTPVDNFAPIPGGCNLVTPIDTDPNLQLTYSTYTTTVTFQDGNLGYNATSGGSPGVCSTSNDIDQNQFRQLQYTLYRKQLAIGDYSIDNLFDALEGIIKGKFEGLPRASKDSSGIKSVMFDSYTGDGAVYVVMATSLVNGKTSVYVPAVTYSCVFDSNGFCTEYTPLINKIVGPILGVIGLFLCFLSHRLFHLEVPLFTFVVLFYGLFILDCAVIQTSMTIHVSVALAGAVIFTFLLFLFWFFTGWYMPFVLLFTGSSGFLLAAVLLYTPFSSLTTMWTISYVYGLLIACAMVVMLIPGVIFPRAMNIFSSSLVGGYLVIFAVSTFVYTSLDEIVLRVVKNASINGYLSTTGAYPFQLTDIILSCVWFFLLLVGIIIQGALAKGRDPFPQKSLFKSIKCKRRQPLQLHVTPERQNLMGEYCTSPSRNSVNFYGST